MGEGLGEGTGIVAGDCAVRNKTTAHIAGSVLTKTIVRLFPKRTLNERGQVSATSFVSHDADRHFGRRQYALRHAAENEVGDPLAPMRPHNDEVRADGRRR